MMRAVFPNEDTVFGPILLTFAPWATAVGMGSFRLPALTPITVTVMSRVPKGGSACVMVVLLELLDCGAVERRRRISGDLHLFQPSVRVVMIVGVVGVIFTPKDGSASVVRVVGVIFTPWDRPASVVGVVGVARTSENRLLVESRVNQVFVVQLAQIDFVPRVLVLSIAFVGQSRANKSQSQDRNEEDGSRHLPPLFAGGNSNGVFVCLYRR